MFSFYYKILDSNTKELEFVLEELLSSRVDFFWYIHNYLIKQPKFLIHQLYL